MSDFTVTDLAKCAEREVKQRRYVYERRVATGRMSREKADKEIAMMQRIFEDYTALAAKERLL